ncbi:hypothetical protein [Streptomyces sp. NBC_00286]|nr:hypothetical protein [Streptomyces sp. NBC_00286]
MTDQSPGVQDVDCGVGGAHCPDETGEPAVARAAAGRDVDRRFE